MSGGERYWNERTQRWEDGTEGTAHVTPPPPARPEYLPQGDGAGVPAPPVPWPDPVRPSPPAAPGWRERRRMWAAVVAAAAVVGVTVALVLVQVNRGDADDGPGRSAEPQAGGSVSPSVSSDTYLSATPEAEPSPSVSPSPTGPELPVGYAPFVDPQGFRIALPIGWTRQTVASEYGMDVVNFRSPTGEQRLQVFEVAEASPQESFDLFLSPQTAKAPGFDRLALDDLAGDVTGARLEYLADSIRGEPDVGTWHVVDVRFVAADGARYAIAAYGRDDDGRDNEFELAGTGLDWFCPSTVTCDTAM
ncbi:hypothetical protein [Streptomyces cadmiisoli]|uniref:hypothetical protein n=1 Tax=Streptomyces cadmiisoli TaxID=2184053 RepID=UPI003D74E447